MLYNYSHYHYYCCYYYFRNVALRIGKVKWLPKKQVVRLVRGLSPGLLTHRISGCETICL